MIKKTKTVNLLRYSTYILLYDGKDKIFAEKL